MWARLADGYKPLQENRCGPERALNRDEEEKLFQVASSNPRWETAYYAAVLATHTSCRSKELRELRLVDVNLMDRTITVRRSTTKMNAGCRIIPLDATATKAAARLIERAQMLGSRDPSHYLFPFCRFRQTKLDTSSVQTGYDVTRPTTGWRSAWESLREKAGLSALRFHDLRHHCITKLAESGVPDHVIVSIAGHVSKEMLEHYSHIRMEAKRQAVAMLDQSREHGLTVESEPVVQ